MTVDELIEHLRALPVEHRALEARLWLPGSQFTIDGTPTVLKPGKLNNLPVVVIEGNMVAGSALCHDVDEELVWTR